MVFISVDVFVKVANIKQKRRAVAAVQVGQKSVLNQAPKFPFAHAKIFRSLSGAEKAMLRWGRKTHMQISAMTSRLTIAQV